MEQKKDKVKRKIVFYLIPVILFLGFVFYMAIRTFPGTVHGKVANTALTYNGFVTLSDELEDVVQENFYGKNYYINLNGLVTKTLGINTLNERQKLADGQLVEITDEVDVSQSSENVINLNNYLEDQGIDFIYVLSPRKDAFYDVEFSPGYSSTRRKSNDAMIAKLEEAGVTTIDMNAWFEENAWTMDEVYFKTDHHWTPHAGLAAARETMSILSEQGLADYDGTSLEESSYNITTLPDWFLGSSGKRVGTYYAGVDDLDVYFPNFATNYSYAGLTTGTTNWTYTDSPLNTIYMDRKNYFGDNPYSIYLYGDYPLQVIINAEATNDKRVLVTGNSVRAVYQYFLTTQFKENYYIDLRHYTDGTFIQFVEEIQPDIIIMCTENVEYYSAYRFGLEEYISALENTPESQTDVEILQNISVKEQEENSNNFVVLYDNLEPNQTYTLTVDSTSYSGGEDLFIQMTLEDLTVNQAIYNRYFEANSNDKQKWIFTVPEGVDTYSIYLYAGTKGHTENVSVDVTNVTLYKGVLED